MEITVEAPNDGVVTELSVGEGHPVAPGQRVAVLKSEPQP
jgi:biotin carboxyl carrier protein